MPRATKRSPHKPKKAKAKGKKTEYPHSKNFRYGRARGDNFHQQINMIREISHNAQVDDLIKQVNVAQDYARRIREETINEIFQHTREMDVDPQVVAAVTPEIVMRDAPAASRASRPRPVSVAGASHASTTADDTMVDATVASLVSSVATADTQPKKAGKGKPAVEKPKEMPFPGAKAFKGLKLPSKPAAAGANPFKLAEVLTSVEPEIARGILAEAGTTPDAVMADMNRHFVFSAAGEARLPDRLQTEEQARDDYGWSSTRREQLFRNAQLPVPTHADIHAGLTARSQLDAEGSGWQRINKQDMGYSFLNKGRDIKAPRLINPGPAPPHGHSSFFTARPSNETHKAAYTFPATLPGVPAVLA